MNQAKENEYWYYLSEKISHKDCQRLINLNKDNWVEATAGGHRKEKGGSKRKTSSNVRKSEVAFVDDQWVYDLIWPFMTDANENAGWKYNIVAAESCQIARYTKGGFYTWHKDGIGAHNGAFNLPDNKFLHGNVRKLSMTILLNGDYEGGHFQMHGDGNEIDTPVSGEGSVIVFPSFIEHQVTPVTKGIRYSLVTWFVGPPFV